MLPFCSPPQLLHTPQCTGPPDLFSALWPIFNSSVAPELIERSHLSAAHWTTPSLAAEGSDPTGAAYADAAKRLFHTGEVELASSALLRIWLNTKTSCVGPAHQATLAAQLCISLCQYLSHPEALSAEI